MSLSCRCRDEAMEVLTVFLLDVLLSHPHSPTRQRRTPSVVTFTNKAANEMKVRLAKIVGAATVDKVVMGTFHSFVPASLSPMPQLTS